MKQNTIQQALSLISCILLLLAITIWHNHKIFGHDLQPSQQSETVKTGNNDEGQNMTINTTTLAKDITGYGGNTPLEITVKNGIITDIKALENQETPSFFEQAATLLDKWKGKTVEEAKSMKVDAVSGATFSSKAIIGNMQRGLDFIAQSQPKQEPQENIIAIKNIIAIVVVLMAAILPLFIRNKRYLLAQSILNIVVLGFWCGQFLSYTAIIGFFSNGINTGLSIIITIMLITAFIYPLFGKKSYYCTHVCPFGSLQQLAGQCNKRKIKISSKTLHRLDNFRQILWAFLMLCLWTSTASIWIDYEPFTAFIIQSATWPIIIFAVIFIILSIFIQRPYCRFICPTGSLFKLSQTSK